MDHILGYFLCLLAFLLALIPLMAFTGNPLMEADRNRRKSQDSRRPGEGHLGSETPSYCGMGLDVPCSILAGATVPVKGRPAGDHQGAQRSVGFSSAQVRDKTCHETSSREIQDTQKLQDSGRRGSNTTKQHYCIHALHGHGKWRREVGKGQIF